MTRQDGGVAVQEEIDVGNTVVLRRYWQKVVEVLLLFVVSLLIAVLFGALGVLAIELGMPPMLFFVLPVGAYVLALFLGTLWLEVWCPHRRNGTTPVKRWFGLRIVTLTGAQPSLGALFVRWLLMTVDAMLLGLVGAVLIACTPRNQRLGDLVARTVVVRVR